MKFMVALTTTKGIIKFNLKTTGYAGEIAFCQTITKLMSEKSKSKINITTSDGKLQIKVSDIIDLKFHESEYVKSKVCIK